MSLHDSTVWASKKKPSPHLTSHFCILFCIFLLRPVGVLLHLVPQKFTLLHHRTFIISKDSDVHAKIETLFIFERQVASPGSHIYTRSVL